MLEGLQRFVAEVEVGAISVKLLEIDNRSPLIAAWLRDGEYP
jgi:hypothetical protein